jgi:hypothetical protein
MNPVIIAGPSGPQKYRLTWNTPALPSSYDTGLGCDRRVCAELLRVLMADPSVINLALYDQELGKLINIADFLTTGASVPID